MRRKYIHDDPYWPSLRWDEGGLAGPLAEIRHRQGRLLGRMEDLGFDLRQEAVLETITGDVIKSSEIEGERLDGEQVRSSVARRLGMDIGGLRSRGPQRGRRRKDDDGRDVELRPAPYGGAAARLALIAVPDGPDRHEADYGRRVAGRQRRADAGGVRADGPGAGALRGPARREAGWGDGGFPGLVRRACGDQTGCSGPGWRTCGS